MDKQICLIVDYDSDEYAIKGGLLGPSMPSHLVASGAQLPDDLSECSIDIMFCG